MILTGKNHNSEHVYIFKSVQSFFSRPSSSTSIFGLLMSLLCVSRSLERRFACADPSLFQIHKPPQQRQEATKQHQGTKHAQTWHAVLIGLELSWLQCSVQCSDEERRSLLPPMQNSSGKYSQPCFMSRWTCSRPVNNTSARSASVFPLLRHGHRRERCHRLRFRTPCRVPRACTRSMLVPL